MSPAITYDSQSPPLLHLRAKWRTEKKDRKKGANSNISPIVGVHYYAHATWGAGQIRAQRNEDEKITEWQPLEVQAEKNAFPNMSPMY